jgi:hypothetical protein
MAHMRITDVRTSLKLLSILLLSNRIIFLPGLDKFLLVKTYNNLRWYLHLSSSEKSHIIQNKQ